VVRDIRGEVMTTADVENSLTAPPRFDGGRTGRTEPEERAMRKLIVQQWVTVDNIAAEEDPGAVAPTNWCEALLLYRSALSCPLYPAPMFW
jgi:hypothetical protein